ncbi:hypothetical protein DAPPUDRAFT_308636 [Daphnia pulex]|uniref:Uncharacterized protein n=1 Tax=Daphnia pulex TaxID=6669 RepID=E9H8L3_DAPPU|nr:hypothetical protein DAPPUDRAFT_308636 [Daphnia pulex]|eukprot:EFX71838.1 hypothetical protein DAPPUDRAFT_308636 [Daphnia pulex]
MMLVSKICAAILLAVLRLGAGLLPLKVYQKLDKWSQRGDLKAAEKQTINKRRKRVDLFMSVFLCFGAGLLLSTCFIHMIPEVRDSFDKVIKSGQYPALEQFPFPEAIVVLGFFAVYLFEELGELLMGHGEKKKKKKKANAAGSPTVNGQSPVKMVTSDSEDDRHKLTIITVPKEDIGTRRVTEEGTDNDSDDSSHHGHNHHGHSHGPPPILSDLEERSVAAAIRGFLLVFALSFHSIFEGMAIGLQPTLKDIWFLFAAVTVHELAIMFCIGMEMLASHIRVGIYIAYMVTLGLITPIGVAIGIFVTEYFQDPTPSHTLTIGILQGVAAGTLLYVTFLEVLERERRKSGNGLIKLLSVFVGFVLLSSLEALGGHGEPTTDHQTQTTVGLSFVLQPVTTPRYTFYSPKA